jgi:hypothetical protein
LKPIPIFEKKNQNQTKIGPFQNVKNWSWISPYN